MSNTVLYRNKETGTRYFYRPREGRRGGLIISGGSPEKLADYIIGCESWFDTAFDPVGDVPDRNLGNLDPESIEALSEDEVRMIRKRIGLS